MDESRVLLGEVSLLTSCIVYEISLILHEPHPCLDVEPRGAEGLSPV